MKMINILLIFTLYQISDQVGCADVKVKGYEGGSVIINYSYNSQEYSNHTKYFCKIKGSGCKSILNQKEKKWDLKGKFFAVDEIAAGVYSMLIRNLTQEDGGNYTCGVEDQQASQLNVKLDVENGLYCGKSLSQTTHPGDNVTFSCIYPEVHEKDLKSVYKVTSQRIGAIIFAYVNYEEKDRFVLHVSSRDKVISMNISNVTVDDGGLYLCGVSVTSPSYVSIFSEMHLQVTGTANIPSPDSSLIIIPVYVGVILLLITGFALIVYRLWSMSIKAASSAATRRNPANREATEERERERRQKGACSVCYEEIQDPQVIPIYATPKNIKTRPISPNPACRTATSSPNTANQDVYLMVQNCKIET